MTVSTITRKKSYTANGATTVFAYDFRIFNDSDLKVYVNSVLQTIVTHYTVSGAGSASGGNVTFGTPPGNTLSVVIIRELPRTQSTDYVDNSALSATSLEDTADKNLMLIQEIDDKAGDGFRFADTVVDAGVTTVAKNAADRSDKLLSFDSSGDLIATQEIGTSQGNWAASTVYAERDIIKDTSNNNIYLCITAHTSSGAQPISSNTDVAKWVLLVDAASATTSATAAASSATAASSSASAASSSASAASSSASAASSSATSASTSASTATAQASAASTSATNAANSATTSSTAAASTAANVVSTAADAVSTAADVVSSGTNATTATTKATAAATSATGAASSATSATSSASSATSSASSATSSASTATTQATAAAASATAAAAPADAIDDVYLGAKSSDPSVDNDGDALTAGDWYFNTSSNISRMYSGSSWSDVSVSAATVVTKTATTGSAVLPSGTTGQRDGSPVAGYLRWNSTDTTTEVYDGSTWSGVGGGGPSLGTDSIIRTNAKTISEDITFAGSENGMTVGPISVASGYSVVVTSGSTWTII